MNRPQPETSWLVEYWTLARVLLLDGALFITILAVLLITFVILKAFVAAGYDQERVKAIESVHYYTYITIQVMLGFDVVAKFLGILLHRKAN
jgi:hypothetical protein